MKNLKFSLFLSISLSLLVLISILAPAKLYATDITVGAATWYSWWDFKEEGNNMDLDPAFLFGPALSVKFNDDFNLTFVYLYGKYDQKGSSKVKRSDSDLAINYRLNYFLKLFAGAKYMNFSSQQDFDHSSIGPGLGLNAALPIGENLFLLATLSGFCLWGDEDGSSSLGDYKEYGINSTLSFAYYIARASTTVSLGGRFQYFKTDYDDFGPEADIKHKFYGVTLTATYTFGI